MRHLFILSTILVVASSNYTSGQSLRFEAFDFGYSNFQTTFKQTEYGEFYSRSRHQTTLLDTSLYVNQSGTKTTAHKGVHFRFHWEIDNGVAEIPNRHKLKMSFKNGFLNTPLLELKPTKADTPTNYPSYTMALKEGSFGIGFEYAYAVISKKHLRLLSGVAFIGDFSISRKLEVSPMNSGIDTSTTANPTNHTYFLDQNPTWGIRPYLALEIPLRKMTSFYCRYHYGLVRYNLEGVRSTLSNSGWQLGLKFNI